MVSVDKENFLEFRMIKLSSFGPFNIYILFMIKVDLHIQVIIVRYRLVHGHLQSALHCQWVE